LFFFKQIARFEMPEIVETSKTTTTTKNATHKKIIPRNNSPLHTSELEKGRFSFDFGKRNDRAERIAGNDRDVSFASTTFRAKIALRILVRVTVESRQK
jgi:hypothetical protein|tara:strand:+ start:47 stop:343 length:297 start_codon:yes stop_codon:yes gene_type:complete